MEDPEGRTVVWRRPGATNSASQADRIVEPTDARAPVVNVNQPAPGAPEPYPGVSRSAPVTPLQIAVWRAQRVIYYVFGVVEAIIAIRFVLKVIGANPASIFTQGVYGVSWVFVFPFNNVVANSNLAGTSVIEWFSIVAVIVYVLGAWALAKLIALLI